MYNNGKKMYFQSYYYELNNSILFNLGILGINFTTIPNFNVN